jgi:hypothetical protein
MTWDEYRDALETLGLNQQAGAKLLGVHELTSGRWACGNRSVPEPAARFLRYLIATKKTGAQAMRVLDT